VLADQQTRRLRPGRQGLRNFNANTKPRKLAFSFVGTMDDEKDKERG